MKLSKRIIIGVSAAIFSFLVLTVNWLGLGLAESKLIPALPAFIGCFHPQKYFVAFTSSSEARTLGGLIGQYAVVETHCTSLIVKEIGTNLQLNDSKAFLRAQEKYPDIFLGKNTEWTNSNLIPDGQLIGSMWLDAYKEQTGQKLDGAIALDLPFLVDLAILSDFSFKNKMGNNLSSRTEILDYLLNGIYFDYPIDNLKRKALQLEISRKMANSIANISPTRFEFLKLFLNVIKENRIFIYRPGFSDNTVIKNVSIFYNSNSGSRYIFIGPNNLSGNKFDFYNEFQYSLRKCQDEEYELQIRINNSALPSSKFPEYVNRRLESSPTDGAGSLTQILLILPRGATIPKWVGPTNWTSETLRVRDGRTLATMVGTVQAGKNYVGSFFFSGLDSPRLLTWGQRLDAPTKVHTCPLPSSKP